MLAEGNPDVQKHVIDQLFQSDDRLPAPVCARMRIVKALRPAIGDGLPVIRTIVDMKIRLSRTDRCRQLPGIEAHSRDVVGRTDADLLG